VLVDLAVYGTRLDQLLVRAARSDPPAVEDDDLVRERDRRETVRDDQRRPALHHLAQAGANAGLRRCIDRGGGVVEDKDPRVDREGARDRDPLPLSARERDAALADHRLVPLRQSLDEFVRLREPRDALDLLVAHVGTTEGHVLAHGRGEEERVLRDDPDLAPQRGERDVADVDAVHEYAPRVDVVEARHERGERRLARARVADQRHRRPGLEVEVELLENRAAGQVRERDVLEADRAVARRQVAGAGRVGDLLRLVEHLEDSLARRGRTLRLADPHAEGAERHDEQREIEVE
jgi:hypothetical protein